MNDEHVPDCDICLCTNCVVAMGKAMTERNAAIVERRKAHAEVIRKTVQDEADRRYGPGKVRIHIDVGGDE